MAEIIIRFDENNSKDVQQAQELLDRLTGRDRDPFERSREELWRVLESGIDQISNFSFSTRSMPILWKSGIHTVGQLVTMSEGELERFFSKKATFANINRSLMDFNSRLHLFMSAEELLGWQPNSK